MIDLRKAFDLVDHSLLLTKLELDGVEHSSIKWFQSYLKDTGQIVGYNGYFSDQQRLNISVPKDPFGSTVFNRLSQ